MGTMICQNGGTHMKKRLQFLSFLMGCAMLFYAIPRFSIANIEWNTASIYAVAWFSLAFLVIAAQLYKLLGMDDETAKQIERVKLAKRKRQEEMWQRMMRGSRHGSR